MAGFSAVENPAFMWLLHLARRSGSQRVQVADVSASAAKSCSFRLRSLSLTGAPVASWIAWRKTHNFMSNILSFKSCDLFLCEIDIERSNPTFQVFHFCCSNNRSYDSRFCSHPGSGDLPHGYAASIRNRLHGIYNAFIGFLGFRIERFRNIVGLTSFSIFLRTPWTSQDPASERTPRNDTDYVFTTKVEHLPFSSAI